MTSFAELMTGRRDVGVPANGRRLGALALGTLLGAVPALAAAAERDLPLPAWAGALSAAATATATSGLALGRPAATFTVTTAADVVDPGDGKLSLREAVAKANATPALDAIVFKPSLEGQTLVLTGGELVVSQDLIIDGDRDDNGSSVTLSGGGVSRVLNVAGSGTDVALRDITLTEGKAVDDTRLDDRGGGAILLGGGSLAITGCTISGSRSGYDGAGGIYADDNSRLTMTGSSMVENHGGYYSGAGAIGTGSNVTLTIRSSRLSGNKAYYGGRENYGGGAISLRGSLVMEGSTVTDNHTIYASGGGLAISGTAIIAGSTISNNYAFHNDGVGQGGGISFGGRLTLTDSTVAANRAGGTYGGSGGGIRASGELVVRNSTITGNTAHGSSDEFPVRGGGIDAGSSQLEIANSIVAGNAFVGTRFTGDPDIFGTITNSNGHNAFGGDVAGNVPGDRENVPAATIFAAIDPATGGGKLNSKGIVPLKKSLADPAVSAADPLTASATGQLGTTPRPLPAGSLPDLGSVEIDQALSTSATLNNDVLTGTAAANNLAGLAGNDLIKGLGGNDTLNGNDGSDVLDGGPGNNKLNGGTGVDIASFAFSPVAVVVDLSGTTDTAKRGGETDTLTSIEGAIGSTKADSFKGDAASNEFQGGLGKDTATGGAGRDLYDFNAVADSPAGAGRDVIGDFAPGQDNIDLAGVDADSTIPGDQSFRWVGKATLTGAAQLGYYVAGGNTIVRASTDADAAAELEIQLTGKKVLTAADFVP
jgi:hypothetical protein